VPTIILDSEAEMDRKESRSDWI